MQWTDRYNKKKKIWNQELYMSDKAAGIFRHSASHTSVKVDPRQQRNKQKRPFGFKRKTFFQMFQIQIKK